MATLRGSCHCGAVRFEADGEVEQGEVCNCSICSMTAYVHWYVAPERFRLLSDPANLHCYEFGTRVAKNLFCKHCGVSPFRRARSDPDQYDINLRCVEGVDLDGLEIVTFDGRNWEEAIKNR